MLRTTTFGAGTPPAQCSASWTGEVEIGEAQPVPAGPELYSAAEQTGKGERVMIKDTGFPLGLMERLKNRLW